MWKMNQRMVKIEIKKCENNCMYSRAINQEYPRKCVKCGCKESGKKMNNEEIKPIEWDSLPIVWAWGFDVNKAEKCTLLKTEEISGLNMVLNNECKVFFAVNISRNDPRPKKRMRTMTAEELNDIYWQAGKDFRFKYGNGVFVFEIHIMPETDLTMCEYSTNRGVTWLKCEVEE